MNYNTKVISREIIDRINDNNPNFIYFSFHDFTIVKPFAYITEYGLLSIIPKAKAIINIVLNRRKRLISIVKYGEI